MLRNTEFTLNLLERDALGFRHDRQHPDQLFHHPQRIERKYVSSGYFRDNWKCKGNDGDHHPVNKAAQRLSARTYRIWGYFSNKNPDHRALSKGMRGNEYYQADQHDKPGSVGVQGGCSDAQ